VASTALLLRKRIQRRALIGVGWEQNREVTGERLALARGIVEGLLMTGAHFAFVMWIA